MSDIYMKDTSVEYIKTNTEYQEVEKQAVKLLLGVVDEDISYELIDIGFNTVRSTLLRLVAENGIRLGFPFWLKEFLNGPYAEWSRWYMLHTMYLKSRNESDILSLIDKYPYITEMVYDDSFKKACMYCLNRLSRKANNADE